MAHLVPDQGLSIAKARGSHATWAQSDIASRNLYNTYTCLSCTNYIYILAVSTH